LEYQQADLQFDKVKDWQVALDEIPPEVPTIPARVLKEMEFDLK
jgi:hypothetical protein